MTSGGGAESSGMSQMRDSELTGVLSARGRCCSTVEPLLQLSMAPLRRLQHKITRRPQQRVEPMRPPVLLVVRLWLQRLVCFVPLCSRRA